MAAKKDKEQDSSTTSYGTVVEQIRQKKLAPVYLLHGEEPFFIDQLTKMFEEDILTPEERDFNQVVLYGKDTTVDMVVANAKQFPFGSPYRVVILKEAKDLKNIELLKPYVDDPSPQTILVVCHKYGKLKSPGSKTFAKHGVAFESIGVKDYQLSAWIQNLATQTFNFKMSPTTAEILSEHIGNDLSRIFTEFQKLQVILPPNSEITPDVVEKYIGISKEYNIFELQEALGTRNMQKAYKIALNFTLYQKDNPLIRTISMLFTFYNKMIRYHLAPDKSINMQKIIYGPKLSNNILAKNIGYANNHPLPQLMRIISILRDYDAKSKGVEASSDGGELLKEMIYKITHV